MITQNELIDLSFVLSLIRNDIENSTNIMILDTLVYLLQDPNEIIQDNQIRQALASISGLNKEWNFIYYENYYVRTVIIKNANIQNKIKLSLLNLKLLLQSNNFEQGYDLADALHVLPTIIAENNGDLPYRAKKIFIKPYEKKWKVKLMF